MNTENAPKVTQPTAKSVAAPKPELTLPPEFPPVVPAGEVPLELEVGFGVATVPV
jgi:hypothetical protein